MIAVVALLLLVQDPPPGEVISTAPPPANAAALADPFAPEPSPPRNSRIRFNSTVPTQPRTEPAIPAESEAEPIVWGTTLGMDGSVRPPLPRAAYEDPIRYAAEACRTENRPQGEDMASCYSRIESTVAASRRPAEPPRRPRIEAPPRMVCENSQSRDADGRTSSTSGRCTMGTGNPDLIDDLLDFD